MEEAEALQALREAHGLSQEELAEQLGKSRSAVANACACSSSPRHAGHPRKRRHQRRTRPRPALRKRRQTARRLHAAVLQHHLSVRETESAADVCKRTGALPEKLAPGNQAQPPRTARAPKPQIIKNLQSLLRQSSGTKATISGNEQQGRIQIPYASPEELTRILSLLGLNAEEK